MFVFTDWLASPDRFFNRLLLVWPCLGSVRRWAKAAEGLGLLPEQAEKIYKEMDADGDGKVDFGEFLRASQPSRC